MPVGGKVLPLGFTPNGGLEARRSAARAGAREGSGGSAAAPRRRWWPDRTMQTTRSQNGRP